MIDTHSHLFAEEFDDDRAEVVARAKEAGVERIVMPNIDSTSVERMLEMCRDYPGYCYPTIGLHPTSVTTENMEEELAVVERYLKEQAHTFVAIGEIGLDLYWDRTYLNEQLQILRKQFDWAIEYDLPVIIHCRDAWKELFECMEPYKTKGLRGVFHSFTGGKEEAREMLTYNSFVTGINGVVTFKKSTLPEVLKHIPVERLVLETDSPYLAPVPNRGKRNESANVKFTLQKIADVYDMEIDKLEEITTKSAQRLFKWTDLFC